MKLGKPLGKDLEDRLPKMLESPLDKLLTNQCKYNFDRQFGLIIVNPLFFEIQSQFWKIEKELRK